MVFVVMATIGAAARTVHLNGCRRLRFVTSRRDGWHRVRPATPCPAGWVMVPVCTVPIEAPRPSVIDIDVLGENGTRRE